MIDHPIAAQAQAVVALLQPLATYIEGEAAADDHTRALVSTSLTALSDAAGALGTTQTAAESLPLVDQIVAYAQALLGVAAGLALPMPLRIGVMVAQASLPALSMIAGILRQKVTPVTALA